MTVGVLAHCRPRKSDNRRLWKAEEVLGYQRVKTRVQDRRNNPSVALSPLAGA